MHYESQVPHVDLQYDNGEPVDHKVLLYYINDSDGPTYFFNESYELQDTVYPKPGRAIIFDGSNIHAASNPVRSPFRMVVNIDFQTYRWIIFFGYGGYLNYFWYSYPIWHTTFLE